MQWSAIGVQNLSLFRDAAVFKTFGLHPGIDFKDVIQHQKTAKDEQQFKANWLSAAKKVDKVAVQNQMAGVKRKARQFGFGKAEA